MRNTYHQKQNLTILKIASKQKRLIVEADIKPGPTPAILAIAFVVEAAYRWESMKKTVTSQYQ